ncbi:MAG TPA: histidine--tRNA ligase [Bacillota bacterium]|nr:histidine--tRNA ligase [Bacillota bacterium]
MNMKAPRGTKDLLPNETSKWEYVERIIKEICHTYHYSEIRTPLFEHTEVFKRGVGDSTDIVQKEMYTFQDQGGRSITLRPEGTASVARAFVENKLYGNAVQPVKLYYFMQMFRYERPQHGRMRQLNQFGVEVLGSANPQVDAEVIDLAMTCYKKLGISSLKLVINSLGDKQSRDSHREALIKHFNPVKDELCSDCNRRLNDNPLRVLDCKKDRDHPAMKTAPSILDHLNETSLEYFNQVKAYLDMMDITYTVDPNLVRGLDYYNHTAFEIMSEAEGFGAITTLLGGGRYNNLTQELGGPDVPGIGFGMGLERLLLAMEAEGADIPLDEGLDTFIITMGEDAENASIPLIHQLRENGIQVDKDYMGRKMKSQFKVADRVGAKYVIIIGGDELQKQVVPIRNMATGEQMEVPIKDIVETMKDKLSGGNEHG